MRAATGSAAPICRANGIDRVVVVRSIASRAPAQPELGSVTTTTNERSVMEPIYLGEPTGPRLRQLSRGQEALLNAWLTSAMTVKPRRREPLPVDFTRALGALAKRRGIPFRFNGDRMRVRGEVVLGKNLPGCVGGSKRRVVVCDERGLVAKAGRKVEPWNDRPWRA